MMEVEGEIPMEGSALSKKSVQRSGSVTSVNSDLKIGVTVLSDQWAVGK